MYINEWIALIGAISLCFSAHYLIKSYLEHQGKKLSKTINIILAWVIALSILVPFWIKSESSTYKDQNKYYVNLFEEERSQKNYRVPGSIAIEGDGIHLLSVDWSNGGFTSFQNYNNSRLIQNEKVLLIDDEDRKWYVELTNKEVE